MVLAAWPLVGGARLTPSTAPLGKGPTIRVLLLEAPLITVGAAGKKGLQLKDPQGRTLLLLNPGQQLRLERSDGGLTVEPLPPPHSLVPALGALPQPPPNPRLLPLQEVRLEPVDPQDVIVLKQRRYRGALLLRPEGQGLQAINRLPLESYLPGVVGSEMPGSWPLAALKAQAVASRTYALQQLRPAAPFDLKATVLSQVYKGVEAETAAVRQAVAATQSQVLMHGQQLINAVFHSSSGGRTENSGDLWSRQMPYLVSVPDFDGASPVSRWEKDFDREALRRAFAEIGGVTTIQPLEASKTGRIRRAKVVGPGGSLVVTGPELRERLGLRSTLVEFHFEPAGRMEPSQVAGGPPVPQTAPSGALDPSPLPEETFGQDPDLRLVVKGRGYGHGVGMSQWGAYALALRGKSYEDILRHYYRGAVLRSR